MHITYVCCAMNTSNTLLYEEVLYILHNNNQSHINKLVYFFFYWFVLECAEERRRNRSEKEANEAIKMAAGWEYVANKISTHSAIITSYFKPFDTKNESRVEHSVTVTVYWHNNILCITLILYFIYYNF